MSAWSMNMMFARSWWPSLTLPFSSRVKITGPILRSLSSKTFACASSGIAHLSHFMLLILPLYFSRLSMKPAAEGLDASLSGTRRPFLWRQTSARGGILVQTLRHTENTGPRGTGVTASRFSDRQRGGVRDHGLDDGVIRLRAGDVRLSRGASWWGWPDSRVQLALLYGQAGLDSGRACHAHREASNGR
jgi:hypothetical protein